MFLTMIYILTLLGLYIGLVYFVADSFENKEYGYTICFGFYAMFLLFLIGHAVSMLIKMI